MKHQVVFGIWTARELRGEGGVAIHQLWFSPYPAHPARAVAESGDDRGPESAGHVGEMAVCGQKRTCPEFNGLRT